MPVDMSKNNRKHKNRKSNNKCEEIPIKKMKLYECDSKKSQDSDIVEHFILTDQSIKSVKLLEYCSDQNVCVLLSGPVGSGKTALVEYVAQKLERNLFKIQISDDTDARTLLGGYCCTEIPGRFEWRQGPLLMAMIRGSWLLLEDVTCGQTNLLGLLRPLLEATSLGIRASLPDPMQPQNNIYAHKDFRIIVTQSLITLSNGYAEPRIACTSYGANCLSKCQPILLETLTTLSIQQIITKRFPQLVVLLPKLIGQHGLKQFVMYPAESKEQSRINSARDLFNFCRRITSIDNKSSEELTTQYFLDACDCFVQHIPDQDYRNEILNSIGSVFNLNKTNVESILKFRICKIMGDPIESNIINIGRVQLRRKIKGVVDSLNPSHYFAQTRQMMTLLESLARCVQMNEPVLLVSETGCGKTSTVQYLSKLVNRKLTVINMNQQSDSSDLLGGYKPVNNSFSEAEMLKLSADVAGIVESFNDVFKDTFSYQQNSSFLVHVKNTYETKDYEKLINLIGSEIISKAIAAIPNLSDKLKIDWAAFYNRIEEIKKKMLKLKCSLTFSFIEGALIQAVKNGDWVLLDEINLAPPEMLQSLSGLLESVTGSIILTERGDDTPVKRHEDFRLFACMNPATDVGKRNLPQSLRNRFTEIYLQELTNIDELSIIVKHYVSHLTPKYIDSVVQFYLALRTDVKNNQMIDGGGSRPQFSLRTLCRALDEIKNFTKNELYRTTFIRALFEGLSFSFKSQLSDDSRELFDKQFQKFFPCKLKSLETAEIISKSLTLEMLLHKGYKVIMGYPIKLGPRYESNIEETDEFVKGYKITSSVSKNLRDLARIICGGKPLPVLVQGETSVGKTSLIMYLAKLTGHIFHRINNHESTDIQEYLGCYVNETGEGSSGKLVFKEGVLAEAMRKGHWIILDELNLAPTDILEALNRVLDDNRELFIAETQTTIKAHPMFRIFATQNPPGLYGGRKVLSRALKNRFIELHFNPIPNHELVEILHECCKMPKSRGEKMVEAMRQLQSDSKELDIVHSKRSYISLRDLFRWARRVYCEHSKSTVTFDWDRHMVEEGYLLLTGKARSEEEVSVVSKTFSKVFKNVDAILTGKARSEEEVGVSKKTCSKLLNDDWFFSRTGSNITQNILSQCEQVTEIGNIEWTHDFRRMAVLLIRAIQCDEPTLLVGNTGCGKTTICHLAASLHQQELLSINCHMHTEASDFLGGLRPNTNNANDENRLFKWVDGPLVHAMKEGKMFLIDEISLADDSVLERLNSVLESDRKLTLVENGEINITSDDNSQSIEIRASKGFQVFATMNPGGDFGKKELSPALKNRFTEIWCPSNAWSTTERGLSDWINIASRNLNSLTNDNERQGTANVLVHFLRTVNDIANDIKLTVVSIRDLLSWVEFINLSLDDGLSLFESIVHGAHMVIIDAINDKIDKNFYERKLIALLNGKIDIFLQGIRTNMTMDIEKYELTTFDGKIGMAPFFIPLGSNMDEQFLSKISQRTSCMNYSFTSKTTGSNLWRLLRALQVSKKPLLLEGSPGVGKTSLVNQLAKIAGFKVIRINLSEQTDANDLFGCFLPIENGAAGQLSWRDGPMLQALKNGDWILLDEMNLASQSVLECLNACLDHRGEIFIPELNQTFVVKPGQTRLFACQNPMSEGGGRKGLPKSFVNRFTQVYMSALLTEDYEEILKCLYSSIPFATLQFMVQYVQTLKDEVIVKRKFGSKGSPWEFNLRDLCRWCDLMLANQSGIFEPAMFVTLLFIDRFRTDLDKIEARKLYNTLARIHNQCPAFISELKLHVTDDTIRLGQSKLSILNHQKYDTEFLEKNLFLNCQLAILESMMLTVSMGWMTILVGSSGAGKTSLVNILATITGNKLQTMSMNSAMDTTDLLGSFEQQNDGGKFKWMDSMLVQALKNGNWLVLDTVNFCNASVLDRLNGLLEPNGTLLLTERGLLDGNHIEEVKPHPNFRIFLILDPECGGEISKAMRNRGLEIAFIKSDNELCLNDEDILSILTHVHKLSMKDSQNIINFYHKLLNDARVKMPQIRIGNVTSMLQVGALMAKDYSLRDALKIVFGETQMFFNIRDEVYRLIDELTYDEPKEVFISTLSLGDMIQDANKVFVQRDLNVVCQTKKQMTDIREHDIVLFARLFMMATSHKDLHLRLDAARFDSDFHALCEKFATILVQCISKDDRLPFDLRYLPNWAEFKNLDFTQENRMLFQFLNCDNDICATINNEIEHIKPSQVNKNSIMKYTVEEIGKLFSLGKLSRNLLSQFNGFDKQTTLFIDTIRAIDFGALCNVDNVYTLRKVSKMIKLFCNTVPGIGNRWLSTYVYHVSAIMSEMMSHKQLNVMCRQIMTHLDKLDLCQDSDIVDRDELKFSDIKRIILRSEYPHNVLIGNEDQYTALVDNMNKSKTLSIWSATNEEDLRRVLLTTFANISGTEPTPNALVNNFDTETVKLWPFLFNMLSYAIDSMDIEDGVKHLSTFFTDMSHSQFHLPPLPCDFQNRIKTMKTVTDYVLVSDWVKYLISQSQLNRIVASCSFAMDCETEDFNLQLEYSHGFLKTDISNLWFGPDNAVFLLISGVETKNDAIAYFNSLKHTDLVKRTLRSVKERKSQLQFCQKTMLDCSSLLTINSCRIKNELHTMSLMIELQRNCLLACNNTETEANKWLSVVAPWFLSLETDFICLQQKDYAMISITEIGSLWIRWGVVQMKLFAIMEPLDPQTQIYWENIYLTEELELVQREETLSRTYRSLTTGVNQENIAQQSWSLFGAQHPLLHATTSYIVQLREKVSKLSLNVGLRPVGDNKYSQLRQKTLRFLSKYGWNALCDGSLINVKDLDQGFITEWSMASTELLKYMLEDSDCIAFPDLVEPFAIGITRTMSGMSMIMSEHSSNRVDKKKNSVKRITDLFCQFPNVDCLKMVANVINREKEIMEDVEILLGKCDNKIKGRIHIKLLHLCLRLLLFVKNTEAKTKNKQETMMKLLHNILTTFDTLWTKQEEKRIEKDTAAGSVYINKQKVTENLSEEEIEQLEIYLKVSPKSSDLDNMEMSAAMNNAASQMRKLREQLESMENGLLLTDNTVHSVVHIASEIMCGNVHEPDFSVFRDSYRFAATLISSDSANMVESETGNLLTSHLATLTWEIEATETGDQMVASERPYDIYQDPVLATDLYNAGTALETLRTKLTALLDTYPDNSALLSIQKKMNSFLNLSLEFPLIIFISNVEKLIFEIEQWEIVAAKHVSLKSCINDLNQLLVNWRHKELKMWSNTLTTASWKMNYDVSLEFFNFYHILMTELNVEQAPDNFLSINAIIEPLIISLNGSKVGNYKAKLNMFKLLIASLQTVETLNLSFKNRLIQIFNNHYEYYSLYLPNFEQQLDKEYKTIGKELKDFIKTQKWGDAPPKITSVSKCHKIVFKYLRKWNDAIHQPCKAMMVLHPINSLKKIVLEPLSKLELCMESNSLEIKLEDSRMSKWTEDMFSYFRDMWETMERLQRETKDLEIKAAKEANDPENKDNLEVVEKKWRGEVKNLQQRKRYCVTNFVKYLKELGLKIFGMRFPSATALMTHLPLGDVCSIGSSTIRCIGLRLQLDTTDKSEEFAKFNDFKDRLISICDDWMNRICTSTTRIKGKELGLVQLKNVIGDLRDSLCDEILSQNDATEIIDKIDNMNAVNMELLNQWSVFSAILDRNNTITYPSFIPNQLKPTLCHKNNENMTKNLIESIKIEIRQLEQVRGYLTTKKHCHASKKQGSIVESIACLISSINAQFGNSDSLFKSSVVIPLCQLNNEHQQTVDSIEFKLHEEVTCSMTEISSLSTVITDLSSYINQGICMFKSVLLDECDDLSFIKILEHLESLESIIDKDVVKRALLQIKEYLGSMNARELNNCRNLINEGLLNVLKFLVSLDEEYLKVVKNYHEVLVSGLDALLTVTSNLIKDGFCVPDDSAWSEATEDSNQQEKFNNFEMAGMDDGTGTNDVSNQIESESQLEGNNNDEEREDQDDKSDVSDQEDGIEMSEDFKGKSHDPEVNEDNENENENKDELDELEDKMGDVGEGAETELNKDAWDEKDEKEEEENDKNKDDRDGGVTKDDTNEVVADNNSDENDDKNDNKNNKDNKDSKDDNEEASDEGNDELKEQGEDDENAPEERPEPALNEPDNGMQEENVDENNPLDDLFDNEDKLNEDGEAQEDGEVHEDGEVQEDIEDKAEEENIDDSKEHEEDFEKEMPCDATDQSINVAGGAEAKDDKETTYDAELSETQNADGSSGSGGSNINSSNVPSSSGKMDENVPDNETEDMKDEQADDRKSNTSDKRTLGEIEKSFKRKADVIDAQENVDPKKQKITDAFAHLDADQADDGTDQVLDNATAEQQQMIPEINDEEIKASELIDKTDKDGNEDNEMIDSADSKGKPQDKDQKNEKDKKSEAMIVEEVTPEVHTWAQYESKSDYLARQLCEQLRTVLEPTKSNKLGGEYRTGKRLNMRKVIPYIASGFRKDKIWMRRNKPSQREYQVLIGVDNSKSMKYNVDGNLFFESLSTVLNGLTFLEVGQVGVCKFGSSTEVVLPLHQQFSSETGDQLVKTFDFTDRDSKYIPMLQKAIEMFTESRHSLSSSAKPDTSQLLILLTDGDISEDTDDPRFKTLIREANNRGIFIVVVIFDQADPLNSILNSKMFIGDGDEYVRYLDVFPIPNYTVLQDVTKLPGLLTDVLRQWFELASSADKGPAR